MSCHFIPDYLLEKVAGLDHPTHPHQLRLDEQMRAGRRAAAKPAAGADAWQVYTADNKDTLPGTLVRSEAQPASGDAAVDECATGVTETLSLYADLGRSSYDGKGATVVSTVHYEQSYDNAFWNGTELVCGDGDGKIFGRFTKPIDVLGHELTHAVTQCTANFTYSDQSGALNESVSDCFGSCVKQRHLGQDAAAADWLIGEGIFLPGVHGAALRSMKDPGTAYDDPNLGKDPQVGSMSDYVKTTQDNGGVHINSGIPNKAFYLAATAIGGLTWEGAGRIWYAALTSGIRADATFVDFAAATVAAAGASADAVGSAWEQVGVTAGTTAPTTAPSSGAASLTVRRTGGFAGRTVEGSIDLGADDGRSREARELWGRTDLAAVPSGEPAPDRYVYEFDAGSGTVQVHENALTPGLRRLAALALP